MLGIIPDMEIVKLTQTNASEVVGKAIRVLKSGGLVVYPTETTYGIGADCQNQTAVDKLLSYKSGRNGKPISVAVATQEMAKKYVTLNRSALAIYRKYLPGPITVISQGKGHTAKGIASKDGSIGIRISSHPFVSQLISEFGGGVTATGANTSGNIRPYSIQDILENTSDLQKSFLDLVIDAGTLPKREPSTIIDTTLGYTKVTRLGTKAGVKSQKLISHSEAQTLQIASNLVDLYRSRLTYQPLIFALQGMMGAGKTHFVRGLASRLGSTESVSSPTYILAREYSFTHEGRKSKLIHVDCWRMQDVAQLEDLNLQNELSKNHLVVIEWADKFSPVIKAWQQLSKVIWIKMKILDENSREISLKHL